MVFSGSRFAIADVICQFYFSDKSYNGKRTKNIIAYSVMVSPLIQFWFDFTNYIQV